MKFTQSRLTCTLPAVSHFNEMHPFTPSCTAAAAAVAAVPDAAAAVAAAAAAVAAAAAGPLA